MSQRWTYQVVELKPDFLGRIKPELLQELLNSRGAQGWELVSSSQGGQGWVQKQLIFKRPV